MKKCLLLLLSLLWAITACDDFAFLSDLHPKGELRWVMDGGHLTKSPSEIPDTNDFILTVRNAAGEILYEGSYGDSPEALPVVEGSYTVGVVSLPFTAPAFDRPQYGDEQVVVVPAGKSVTVKLQCTLLNAGIRVKTAPTFLSSFPSGELYIKQGENALRFAYDEQRIAYTLPGDVSLLLYNQGRDETLFTRSLHEREILTVNLSAPGGKEGGGSSVSVAVDTTKNWSVEDYTAGGGSGGGKDWENALSVAEAAAHAGEKGVWIHGYIVGGDLTSAGKSVKTSGVTKNTHLALASRSSVSAKTSCVAVELPKGAVRDALNLPAHPELIGRRIYVKGNLVDSYFGTVGLKGTSEYMIPD